MFNIKNSITTTFSHLNLVIQPFYESARLPTYKVVYNLTHPELEDL